MRRFVAVFRVTGILTSILVFLTHMCLVWLVIRDRWARVRWSNRLLRYYARWGLWVMNVKVNPIGVENLRGMKGGLLVGNHLTYMDVLAISSVVPTAFVTSVEIKQTPGLGQICMMAGCLFVERRNKANIHKEISQLREGLQLGIKVTIFPEATSTNGEAILRFRKPLFVSAIDGGMPVYPFCINYRTVGGEPISLATRDKIFWYGDMDFAPHLWALGSSGGVTADLHFLPPIQTTLETDATELSERAQRSVESVFRPVKA